MKITDEILSAFLDAALPESEMEQLRQQLQDDDALTARLAELAMIDSIVLAHYQQIEQQPMPESVLRLLDEPQHQAVGQPRAQLLQFPWWRRVSQQLQQHAAAVACVALFAGYGMSQLTSTAPSGAVLLSKQTEQLLNRVVSGQSYAVSDNLQLTARLSFLNQQGDFCRQYSLQSTTQLTEAIACRHQGQWQQVASLTLEQYDSAGLYQTATAGSVLDSILDQLMAGQALGTEAELHYVDPNKH